MKVGPYDVSGAYVGDCRALLRDLPDGCVQTCVTSPPYWGLRDYGVDGQIGLESTPEAYVEEMVAVFREVRRALRDDGTLWLNLGDSYAGSGRGGSAGGSSTLEGSTESQDQSMVRVVDPAWPSAQARQVGRTHPKIASGLKPKDLVGIPWMVAFALRADGWYLRSDIIWAKPSPMPESVTDRPTKAHEYIFLLSKSESYFYDHEAIKEPAREWGERSRDGTRSQQTDFRAGAPPHRGLTGKRKSVGKNEAVGDARRAGFNDRWNEREEPLAMRNKRSVWTVASAPYKESHFAVFPPALIEPCILAGSRPGNLVLDPFFGSGTTGMVAERNGRRWLGFDLNPAYKKMQARRTAQKGLVFG